MVNTYGLNSDVKFQNMEHYDMRVKQVIWHCI